MVKVNDIRSQRPGQSCLSPSWAIRPGWGFRGSWTEVQNIFITSKGNPTLVSSHFPFHPPLWPWQPLSPILDISLKWNHTIYDLFCLAFFLNGMFLRFIHGIACISSSFPFRAEYYSSVRMDHILCIPSSTDGHIGCFHLLAIANNAENLCTSVCFLFFWGYT